MDGNYKNVVSNKIRTIIPATCNTDKIQCTLKNIDLIIKS